MSDAPTYPLREPGEAPKLIEMIFVANDEAERIENVEAARAAFGEPRIKDRVRRAEVLRATARFLALIEPKLDEVKAMLARKGGRR